ncbi:UDP-glucose dehydrogenase family protein [Fluviispira sanaruensis]|uniref:UDP-glucose 6-dehydrogenase n=1 Tax=Fluviispira sanaruensis TaxID=2493639 RepID=A0A4P2VL61_FLUSA|nr:UDP-glucose/GDP-mannose dehydrogenase family protein [Fluviispira sanaruensis]BBH54046.1 UDP-glucose/GDP-mannose dehydrogenase family protein [Fluviispira sanaruensis]
MNICLIGAGYVGLVSAVCFAEMGHNVICVDKDEHKISLLNQGIVPIYEPGLLELMNINVEAGRLYFTENISEAIKESLFIFIAVGTPQDEDGSADLRHVLSVAEIIGREINSFKIIVNKSTVPVGTAKNVKNIIISEIQKRRIDNIDFDIVSNPEFLKEGDAINDFMRPDRIIIGVERKDSEELMKELYFHFVKNGNPIIFMDIKSAELTKYASNAMLATRISFMNELSSLCDIIGADIEKIRIGIGTDKRIGMSFLYSGLGYGGSCFPKDVQALSKTMKDFHLNPNLLNAVESINKEQRIRFLKKIITRFENNIVGKTFTVWGLSFKPKTDDIRESPAAHLINMLTDAGAHVNVSDPEALKYSNLCLRNLESISLFKDKYLSLKDSEALVIATEWSQYRNPDFELMKLNMKRNIIFDGRNQFEPEKMTQLGWEYHCIGRSNEM